MPVNTRGHSDPDVGQQDIESTPDPNPELHIDAPGPTGGGMAGENTGDPIWDGLMRLPFFRTATPERQEQMYIEKEREKERQIEREREKEREERQIEKEREKERQEKEREERQIEREREKERQETEREKERQEKEREERQIEREREKEREERQIEREREERQEKQAEREKERQAQKEREEREHELRMRDTGEQGREALGHRERSETTHGRVCLPDWSDRTRPEQYLSTCEKLLTASGISEQLWVGQMVHKLSEKARGVYASLSLESANDYQTLKRAILNEYRVAPTVYRKNFFSWAKRPTQTYAEYVKILREQLECWVENQDLNAADWPELLLKYRLETQLTEELSLFIVDKKASSLNECVKLADEFTLNRRLVSKTHVGSTGNRSRLNQAPSRPDTRYEPVQNVDARVGGSNPRDQSDRRSNVNWSEASVKYCRYCQRRGHSQPECFADPNSPRYKGPRQQANQVRFPEGREEAPRVGHTSALASGLRVGQRETDTLNPLYTDYAGEAYVKGSDPRLKFPVRYLRDTGATLSIIYEEAVPRSLLTYTGERVTLRGINIVAGTYPLARFEVASDIYEGPMLAAVVQHRPVPGVGLLMGNDVFAPQRKLEIPCGVVTRARAQKMPDYELERLKLSNRAGERGLDREILRVNGEVIKTKRPEVEEEKRIRMKEVDEMRRDIKRLEMENQEKVRKLEEENFNLEKELAIAKLSVEENKELELAKIRESSRLAFARLADEKENRKAEIAKELELARRLEEGQKAERLEKREIAKELELARIKEKKQKVERLEEVKREKEMEWQRRIDEKEKADRQLQVDKLEIEIEAGRREKERARMREAVREDKELELAKIEVEKHRLGKKDGEKESSKTDRVVVNCDHHALVWLKQSRTSNQRILRLALFLSEYELVIKHIKGRDNVLADLLSRRLPA